MPEERSPRRKKEDKKLRRLQLIVHLTTNLLYQENISLPEAIQHVEGVKKAALKLFPGKEQTWEMLYAPRFHRILKSRWGYVMRRPDSMVS